MDGKRFRVVGHHVHGGREVVATNLTEETAESVREALKHEKKFFRVTLEEQIRDAGSGEA